MVSTIFSLLTTDETDVRIFYERGKKKKKKSLWVCHTQTDAEIRDEMWKKMSWICCWSHLLFVKMSLHILRAAVLGLHWSTATVISPRAFTSCSPCIRPIYMTMQKTRTEQMRMTLQWRSCVFTLQFEPPSPFIACIIQGLNQYPFNNTSLSNFYSAVVQFLPPCFMAPIKLTLLDVAMVKNNNRKSCPLVSLITGGYYSLFVDIVTYLPCDLQDF